MNYQLDFEVLIKQLHHLILLKFVLPLVINDEPEVSLDFLVKWFGDLLADKELVDQDDLISKKKLH